jgi:hypothetical protein
MSRNPEQLRRVEGGVGTINTKIIREVRALAEVGKTGLGIKVPAGSIVVGAFIKNKKNDLVYEGAPTVALVCGDADLIDATAVAELKGAGVGGCFEGHYIEEDTEVELEVAVADITDGTLSVGVLYM